MGVFSFIGNVCTIVYDAIEKNATEIREQDKKSQGKSESELNKTINDNGGFFGSSTAEKCSASKELKRREIEEKIRNHQESK